MSRLGIAIPPSFAPDGPPSEEGIDRLLRRLRPEIEPVFNDFRLSEQEAEEVLLELLPLLTHHWDKLSSHEIWLLATLRRFCLRRLRQRARTARNP